MKIVGFSYSQVKKFVGSVSGPGRVGNPETNPLPDVTVIGADIARQRIQEGLIDEIRAHLAPILLGDGVRFFNWPGAQGAVPLETIDVARSGQLTNLQFPVVK